jgi:hypothetical protein
MSRASKITLRFSQVLRQYYESNPSRFAVLEKLSGDPETGENRISAASWKNVWHGNQKPTIEMLEAISELHPEHAFWLLTGIDDSDYGHSAPSGLGFPREALDLVANKAYFLRATEYGNVSEQEVLKKSYIDNNEQETGKVAINLKELDQKRRLLFSDDYILDDEETPLFIGYDERQSFNALVTLRYFEVVTRKIHQINDVNLKHRLIEQIAEQIKSIGSTSRVAFEVFEKMSQDRALLKQHAEFLTTVFDGNKKN